MEIFNWGFATSIRMGTHNGQGLGIQMLIPITTGFGKKTSNEWWVASG